MTTTGANVTTPPWTTRRLLAWMTERFTTQSLSAPRVVSELLLAHVLECERMRLYMEVDREATAEELARLRDLVRRAAAHEPVQYLVGRAAFFGFELEVDASSLIPQPATEDLVSAVLAWARACPTTPTRIADLGTGSGAVAIAIARDLPEATVLATDVVPAALELAARNATRLGVADRIEFRVGALLEPLDADPRPWDVIAGNLPYISDTEWDDGSVERCVREHVPASATRGGTDGLDFIRPVMQHAATHLRPGGLLALEIGHAQRDAVLALARDTRWTDARVERDAENFWRVLLAHRG
ncbi:MAG: peptide chain release factor N(5)-glutamine methyltransferase [Phycisphaerales bacterium]|nr:peptide chain release factor N(5)-glutamine methyltransferase [Phycisphaerae bacterium]NNF44343.1 peptide chain release factor N(5)-glutamine methyltransferase [Phycisphaerales bacterium]NNM25622.1 peptide chain release factor N(5)-glutamine methyltransferase [Phycisphaerales bacterium]